MSNINLHILGHFKLAWLKVLAADSMVAHYLFVWDAIKRGISQISDPNKKSETFNLGMSIEPTHTKGKG